MDRRSFARSGFRHYARTNKAVIAGVAIAVAVLMGATITGDSVRGSLRDLALSRLGKTGQVLTSAQFFREALAAEMGGAPLIALEGVVSKQEDNQRAGAVQVYGVDERFWKFHGVPERSDYLISPGLAAELNAKAEDSLLLRIEKPSAIPRESLHGRKEDTGKTIRFKAGAVLPRAEMGEFSLKPSQGALKAVFMNLRRLQKDLDQSGRVNTILFPQGAAAADLSKMQLQDLGVKVVQISDGHASVESESAVLSDSLEGAAVRTFGSSHARYYTYLVNSMKAGSREVPYSLVTAASSMSLAPGEIALNEWAARDLGVVPGDKVTLEYYLWDASGTLLTKSASFTLVHVDTTKDDRTLAPEYPGITQSSTLADWDPPFPMDLKKVRPIDEEYWKLYRTTPKGFIHIDDGKKLWGSRFGHLTSVRGVADADFTSRLRAAIDPQSLGAMVVDARALALDSSKGSTDFGEYFFYFSFFLMVSALLLTVVFFQLNVDQRLREAGLLRALGFTASGLRSHFLREGMPLAAVGNLIGIPLGIGYSAFILYGLKTWWRGAVGTSDLTLHVKPLALQLGIFGGLLCAFVTILLSLRSLRKSTPRDLLSGSRGGSAWMKPSAKLVFVAALCFVLALGLTGAGIAKVVPAAGAFFGAGFLSLTGGILWIRNRLRAASQPIVDLQSLGSRNASWKPNRSALCITLIASAVFLLLSLESFRQGDSADGAGGFSMIAESQLPIVYDLNTQAGRDALNLKTDQNKFFAFRLKPGDDASCLNLYEPRNPRVIGASAEFLSAKRFNDAPWNLLQAAPSDDAVPAIADLNSAMYVLHKKVGDIISLPNGAKLRLVATIAGSVLQSEIVISEQQFVRLFPQEQGYRFFLIDGPVSSGPAIEDALTDFGFDASTTRERLAAFHQVENTYLSTFQALGALGLLLGIAGLAAVLMRNVLERRRELGLLRAVGLRGDQLSRMVTSENGYLVGTGVVLGLLCALIAIAPTVIERGVRALPVFRMVVLIALIAIAGWIASIAAVRFVRKLPLLDSLRSDQ
jgi:putative ABC transport system permease protein